MHADSKASKWCMQLMTVHSVPAPFRLIAMSYGQIGMMQALAGFYSWILTYGECGFMIRDIINIRTEWDSKNINDLEDSYGQNWVRRNYWAVRAGVLTPLNFARNRLSPLAAFTSGAYYLHSGRR